MNTILIEDKLLKYAKNLNSYDISMIFGYIYIIILPNTCYYIGQKKGLPDNSINYYGSGLLINNWFKKYLNCQASHCNIEKINTYGIRKVILDYGIDRFELNILEEFYIEKGLELQEFEKQCLNIKTYINNYDYEFTDDHKNKISEKNKGRIPWNKGLTKDTDDRVKLISDKKKDKKRTKEQREKISTATKQAMKNLPANKKEKMITRSMLGKHHSEESKLKSSISNSNIKKVHYKYKDVYLNKCKCISDNMIFNNLLEAAYYYDTTVGKIVKSCENGISINKNNTKLQFIYI